jgi:putative NADH-flavin reductase
LIEMIFLGRVAVPSPQAVDELIDKVIRETVTQGLAIGHHVTAVVRCPEALQARPGLQIAVVPDLNSAESVDGVVSGRDVVISALGINARGDR